MSRAIDSVLVNDEAPLYVAERKVYPRDVRGRLDTLRRWCVVILLGVYYVFPWLTWDGRQAVLFDLPARKFFIFGWVLWPQDFIFLALLLMIAGMALFFFTAVGGRLWCGYACPQTVWTETFLWMERLTEGDRAQRMKLDAGPWTAEKFARKGAKHFLWLIFATWTGFTFVGFFSPIQDLGARIWPFELGGWEAFWVVFYSLATWGNAGVLREQVCKYMCPYARFQGAMFDRHTLIIAYDPMRGEPRGSRKRSLGSVFARGRGLLSVEAAERWLGYAALRPSAATQAVQARMSTGAYENYIPAPIAAEVGAVVAETVPELAPPPPEALGECIDCTLCVQVCPTGIDIRNGLQYECIACGACIDACDSVMDKMGYPRGLVRYTTHNALQGLPTRVLRPRVIVYAILLVALFVGWGWGLTHRDTFTVEALRDRNALYRLTTDQVENVYTLKLVNKQERTLRLRIALAQAGPVVLPEGPMEVTAQAGTVLTVPLVLQARAGALKGRYPVQLVVDSPDDAALRATVDTAFFAPP